MPIESTVSYAPDLNPAYPYDTDPEGQGGAHLRLIKQAVKGTFPNLNGPVTATPTALNAAAALQPSGAGPVIAPVWGSSPQGGRVTLTGASTYKTFYLNNSNNVLSAQTFDGTTTNTVKTQDQNGYLTVYNPSSGKTLSLDPANGTVWAGTTPLSWVGEIRMHSGSVGSIPAGWQLCNGTNGTPDLRDRFIVGAGGSYSPGSTGGLNTNYLTVAQMPSHSHGVNDPTHSHGVNDPGHVHSINDPGHNHAYPIGGVAGGGYPQLGNGLGSYTTDNPSGTNISINGSGSNISIYGNYTGITIQNNGSGAAVENRPPYYAVCFIMRVV